jgi:hypothetical protein
MRLEIGIGKAEMPGKEYGALMTEVGRQKTDR